MVGFVLLKQKKSNAITWPSKKEQIFEMPTGGAAIMHAGENLLYLARKEQCLALGSQLRTLKITQYQIYRIFPSGETQFFTSKRWSFSGKSKSRSCFNEQSRFFYW